MGATPIAMATAMNSRIGKYSASMVLVPTSRLELLRLFRPPAPQAGVSTNFTTWAFNSELSPKKLLRHLPLVQRRRRFRHVGSRLLGFRLFLLRLRRLRLLAADGVDHAAALLGRLARRHVGEREAEREKDRGENRGRARKEVRRAGGAEQAARGAAAEARAHVGALAVLEQHETDDAERHHYVGHDQYLSPEAAHFAAALTMSIKSFATSDAPPISPPSTSGIAKIAPT